MLCLFLFVFSLFFSFFVKCWERAASAQFLVILLKHFAGTLSHLAGGDVCGCDGPLPSSADDTPMIATYCI